MPVSRLETGLQHGVSVQPISSEIRPFSGRVAIALIGRVVNLGDSDIEADNNQLYLIENVSAATRFFGRTNTNGLNLSNLINVLHRYDSGKILVVKVPDDADESDFIGEISDGVSTGLKLFLQARSKFGISPDIIMAPSMESSKAVVDELLRVAEITDSIVIINTPQLLSVDRLVELRNSDNTIYSIRNKRLILAAGYLENSINNAIAEPLSVHLAGILNRLPSSDVNRPGGVAGFNSQEGAGYGVDNRALIGVDRPLPLLDMSMTDLNSDTSKLSDNAFVTVNRPYGSDNQLVAWGIYNSSFKTVDDLVPDHFLATAFVEKNMYQMLLAKCTQYVATYLRGSAAQVLQGELSELLGLFIAQGVISEGSVIVQSEQLSDLENGLLAFELHYFVRPSIRKILLQSQMVYSHRVIETSIIGGRYY